jgi:hypothetical protein
MEEKIANEQATHTEENIITPPSEQEQVQYDAHTEKKLIRKIDWRLLPILGALYSIALIDRVNISAARISGMDRALGLSIGNRYTIALVLFL